MPATSYTDAVVEIDADGRITFATTTAASLVGADDDTVRGRSFEAWLHPDDRDAAQALLRRMQEGDLDEASVRVAGTDDRSLWVTLRRQNGTRRIVGHLHGERRKEVRRHVDAEADRLRLLASVTAQGNIPFEIQLQQALTLTTTLLGFDIGIASRVEGDDYTVVACHAPGADLAPGTHFDLGDTYCAITLGCRDLLTIEHMGASPHRRHPCYKAFGLESYIGTPIYAGGEVWGTLNFSAAAPRTQPTREADRDLVRLLALWIGGALDRQQAEEAAREQSTRLLTAVSNAPIILYGFDAEGTVTLSMGRALQEIGLQDGEAVGTNVFDYNPPESESTRATRRVLQGEAVSWSSAASGRHFETSALPTYGPDGRVTGGICVSVDVTERVEAQQRAEAAAASLQRLLTATSQATRLTAPVEEQAPLVLREMATILDLDEGLLACIADGTFTCLASSGSALTPGDELLLGETYCDLVAEADDVVVIERMTESPHREHPCYAAVGLEAYVGAPVYVRGELYGSLSFSSRHPARRPFTDADRNLVRLAAQWAGALLERRLQEAALADSQRRFRTLSEAAFEGIFFTADGVVLDCNEQGAHLFGFASSADCVGQTLADVVPPESLAKVREMNLQNKTEAYEAVLKRQDGSLFWGEIQGRPTSRDGETVRLTVVRDITKRKEAQAETRFHATVLAHVSDAVVALDSDGRVTYWNAGAEHLHGLLAADVLGRPLRDLVRYYLPAEADEPSGREAADLSTLFRGASRSAADLVYESPSGERRDVSVSASTLRTDRGEATGTLAVLRDVTEQRTMAAELRHQAHHDGLTGLPNRTRFRREIRRAIKAGAPFAVLFVDLDRFKTVNDSLGHDAGDRLLRAVAGRMRDVVDETGTVARLGGDEFAVLARGDRCEAAALAQRLLDALRVPVDLGPRQIAPGASIGVVPHAEGYDDLDALLRDADTAMYEAKREGRGRFSLFACSMHHAAAHRFGLEHDLRQAVERGELALRLQPIVDLQTGDIAGFESLVRWEHPEQGLLSPAAFLPLAEELGLVAEVDLWVLQETCREFSTWTDDDVLLMMSVNCSDQTFLLDQLGDRAREAMAQAGLAPDRLVLELTERALVDSDAARRALAALQRNGIKLSIDDFGSGFSSLGLLHRLPVDGLKIDRSFVTDLATSERARSVVQSVVDLSRALGLRVVAEGVETPDQLRALRQLGAELGQGYLFSKPVPPEEARAMLAAPPWAADWRSWSAG